MDENKLQYLFEQFQQGKLSSDERLEWESYVNSGEQSPAFAEWLENQWSKAEVSELVMDQDTEKAIYDYVVIQPQTSEKTRRLWPRIVAAASILLILSFGTYYLMNREAPGQNSVTAELIAPVQKGVYLTLSNGQKIALDQKHIGRKKVADGTQLDQNSNELSYQQENAATEPQVHTLTNNSNAKYSLVLADGSQAYLDIASSITYPVAFSGKERNVTVTGQVYFKVKHNAAQPFSVHVRDQVIEDIGTEFNIDAYHNIKTTLVQGAVRIHTGATKSLVLKPGNEAYLENNELVSTTADLEMATIWLQGKIPLNHRTLESVLTEVGRIYDVQFIWQDASLKQLKFGGAVSRTQKLSNILNFFRNTGKVDFTVDGKTVTVFKKKK
ncbi:FecR family protein [Mucilaginibacter gracilis]|uniref:FecR family protein n=2 Tax=Mucilaginibacter gracilis TaxID=423350 RepID=A0A495J3Z9_9SPHI|nr:FecR family protein [Mucilaginibacter gracilis]